MSEFGDKDFKTIIITIFHRFKKVEEKLSILKRDIKYTKMTQIKLSDIKIVMSEKKNTLDRINNGLNIE